MVSLARYIKKIIFIRHAEIVTRLIRRFLVGMSCSLYAQSRLVGNVKKRRRVLEYLKSDSLLNYVA